MSTTALPDVEEIVGSMFDGLYEVVVLDDDTTAFDTVISALVEVCGHSPDAASRLAWRVHTEGEAVVSAGSRPESDLVASQLRARGLKVTVRPV